MNDIEVRRVGLALREQLSGDEWKSAERLKFDIQPDYGVRADAPKLWSELLDYLARSGDIDAKIGDNGLTYYRTARRA